jgi:hypothetical protein
MDDKLKKWAIDKLKSTDKLHDEEVAHWNADQILCELIRKLCGEDGEDIVEEWEKIDKWYA